jgi:hypothetical protein
MDLLTILKYGGLAITSLSSIWGINHEFKTKDKDGKLHLTRSGLVAVVLAVSGLLVSASSTYQKDQKDQKIAIQQLSAEAQRLEQARIQRETSDRIERQQNENAREQQEAYAKSEREANAREQRETLRQLQSTQNIILSSQPLTRITISWTFNKVPKDQLALIAHARKTNEEFEVGNEDLFQGVYGEKLRETRSFVDRHTILYPWLNTLSGADWAASPCVMLLSLDSEFSSLLPFGQVHYDKDSKDLPATIEFIEDFDNWKKMVGLFDRNKDSIYEASLLTRGEKITVTWNLPPEALAESIEHIADSHIVTAAMPEKIRIAILNSIEEFPGLSPAVKLIDFDRLSKFGGQNNDYRSASELTFKRNGISYPSGKYKVRFLGTVTVKEDFDPPKIYSKAAVWEAIRLRDNE